MCSTIIMITVISRLEAPCASEGLDLINGSDRADSELSNGGFGLKERHFMDGEGPLTLAMGVLLLCSAPLNGRLW